MKQGASGCGDEKDNDDAEEDVENETNKEYEKLCSNDKVIINVKHLVENNKNEQAER